jgi:hypothetical protein
MKRKKSKYTFFQKRKALRVYERLSLDLDNQIELTGTIDVESFLTSDLTYYEWLNHMVPKQSDLWADIIRFPHYECLPVAIEQMSLADQQRDLLTRAYTALEKYKKTRLKEHLLEYIRLFAEHKGLLQRVNQKFRKIIGLLKTRLRSRETLDRRIHIRRFSRFIFRNKDEEEHLNGFSNILIVRIFIFEFNHHVFSRYFRNDNHPGILFSGYW